MKKIFLLLSILTSITVHGQTSLPKQQLQFFVGDAFHGTGDLSGLVYATEYTRYFKKRLSWSVALGGSIHDGALPLSYSEASGEIIDAAYRYTVAGFQAAGHAGYSFVRTKRHELQFRLGGLLRYQSSSYFDSITILYPLATGYPYPLMAIENRTPQKTYTFGGSTQLLYNYTIKGKYSLGGLIGMQTDSNGDTISQLCFTIGRRF